VIRCPLCRDVRNAGKLLLNGAHRCDCGYDFVLLNVQQSYLGKTEAAQLGLATLGERWLARFLDGLLVFVAAAIAAGVSRALPPERTELRQIVFILCGGGYWLFYVLFADALPGGQSLGKRALRIAVVDSKSGAPCSIGASLLRNLSLSLLGFIDAVFIFGVDRRRLGDRLAGTSVIKARG
jgi:uncharacterized RDD family membrane protein YckC